MKNTHSHMPFLIFALVVTGLAAVVYIYMQSAIGASVKSVLVARNLVRTEQVNKNQEQAVMAAYTATAADRARLMTHFVPADSVVSFIEAIEHIGPQTGSTVTLSGISADTIDGSVPGTTGTVRGHVSAQGSWESVSRALALAEVLPYKVTIDNVELTAAGMTADKVPKRSWTMSFDIQALSIVEASSTPTVK